VDLTALLARRSPSSRVRMATAASTLVLAAVLLGLMGFALSQEVAKARSLAQADALRYSREATVGLDGFLTSTRAILSTLAIEPEFHRQDPEAAGATLARVLAANPQYVNFWSTRADGWNYASPARSPDRPHINIADREYFRRAMETGELSVQSLPDNRLNPPNFSVAMAYPVRGEDGGITGTVAAGFELLPLQDVLSHINLPPSSRITVWDEHGFIIARHPSPEDWVGETVADVELWEAVRSRPSGTYEGALVDSEVRLAGYSTLQLAPWKVVVSVSRDEAYTWVWGEIAFLLLFTGLPALAAISLAWRLGSAAVERVESAEVLRRQGEFLKGIIDCAPFGIAVTRGLEHRFALVNPHFRAGTGASEDQLAGRSLSDLTPSVRDRTLEVLDRVHQTAEKVSLREFEFPLGEGRPSTYWNGESVPLRDPDGHVDGVLILAAEVTEQVLARKRMEEAAEHAEEARELLQAVLEQMPAGVVVAEAPSGNLLMANERAGALWRGSGGAPAEKADDLDHVRAESRDGRSYGRDDWPLVRSLRQGEVVTGEEIAMPAEDGSRVITAINSAPVRDRSGRIVAAVQTMWDVTDRRRQEEAVRASEVLFRAIFEQAATGVAQVGLDGRWIRVNDRLCRILGRDCLELEGLTFQDLTHPEDLETDLEQARRLAAGEIDSYSMEKRYLRGDGSVVWANLTGSAVRDAQGAPSYFIAIVDDITGRKQAEQELEGHGS
jgi:PAS domain S-box-containing protein